MSSTSVPPSSNFFRPEGLDRLRVMLAEVEAARGSTEPLVVTVAATAPVTLASRDRERGRRLRSVRHDLDLLHVLVVEVSGHDVPGLQTGRHWTGGLALDELPQSLQLGL